MPAKIPSSKPRRPLCYTSFMLPRLAFVIVICMTLLPQRSLFRSAGRHRSRPAPVGHGENMQKFSIPALYSTRQTGARLGSRMSAGRIHLQYQWRNNRGRFPPAEAGPRSSHQRPAPGRASLVADGKWIATSATRMEQLWDIFLVSPHSGESPTSPPRPTPPTKLPPVTRLPLCRYMTRTRARPALRSPHRHRFAPTTTSRAISAAARQLFASLVAGWQLARLHPGNASARFQHLPLRPGRKHATNLTPPLRRADFFRWRFSPDGKSLLVTSNAANAMTT